MGIEEWKRLFRRYASCRFSQSSESKTSKDPGTNLRLEYYVLWARSPLGSVAVNSVFENTTSLVKTT